MNSCIAVYWFSSVPGGMYALGKADMRFTLAYRAH